MNITVENDTTVEQIREVFRDKETYGIILKDNLDDLEYPTPLDAAGKEEIFIGRIRKDDSLENTFHLWSVSDNIIKGAALNAVQILEHFITRH